MRLEIVFKDGRKEILDSVLSFNEVVKSKDLRVPVEGKLFLVNPQEIDRSIFEKPREDQMEEKIRQIILLAFQEVDKYPEKYAHPFYTLIPEKKWEGYRSVAELMAYANDLGGYMADWVEQALEWAQRIFEGEWWETICNDLDTAKWKRMIVWKNGFTRCVGGASMAGIQYPPSYFSDYVYFVYEYMHNTVPLVAVKKRNTV